MKNKITVSAQKKILYLPHAIRQMSRIDRMISKEDIRDTVFKGDIIEKYKNDTRGESCLVCYVGNRVIHVVCAPKSEYLAIITAYIPDPTCWSDDFKKRIK